MQRNSFALYFNIWPTDVASLLLGLSASIFSTSSILAIFAGPLIVSVREGHFDKIGV